MSLNTKNRQYSVDAHRQAISPNIMLYIFLESLIQGKFNDARHNTDNIQEHIPICEFIRLIFAEQANVVTCHLMIRPIFYIPCIFPILPVSPVNIWYGLKQIATEFFSAGMHSGEVSLKHIENPLRHLWGKQVKSAIKVTFSH